MRIGQRAAVSLAVALTLGPNSLATGATESTYQESIEVGVVNLEVYVVDKKGNPITDLEVGDFEVLEDDRPVDISNFALIGGGEVDSESRSAQSLAAAASKRQSTSPKKARPLSQPLWLMVYFDNLNLRPADRQRSLKAVRRFLEGDLAGSVQVMVVSFDRSIRVHQSFTNEAESIARALAEIETTPSRGARADDERRDLLQRIDRMGSPREAVETIKYFVDSQQHDALRTLDAMESVLESLSGLPGHKVLLHVSSGLPAVPAAELFMAIEYKWAVGYGAIRMQEWDMKDDYRRLTRNANLHGVTIYALDAAGVRAANSATVQDEGFDSAYMAGLTDSDVRVNLQMPLRLLADETGGTAIVNRNNPAPALEAIGRSLRTHYSLGFSPAHSGDNEFHTVRVEVARKGARVRHRVGYIDKSPETRRSDRLRASLMFSFEENPLNVDLTVGSASRNESNGFVVPLQLEVPLEGIVLLEEGDEYQANLRLLVAFMDPGGGISEVIESPLNLRIPSERFEASTGETWSYTHHLIMNGGDHVLALGLHDEISGLTSYLRRSASVGG